MPDQPRTDLRDAGAARALDASPPDWQSAAWARLRILADRREPFTADTLIDDVGLPNRIEVNGNNAVGALFLRAVKAGLISETGRRVPSTRTGNHGRRVTEWIGTAIEATSVDTPHLGAAS